jgi:hypothetical protein
MRLCFLLFCNIFVLCYRFRGQVMKRSHMDSLFYKKNYPFSQKYYEENLKRLNDKNITIRDNVMLRDETFHNKAKISDEEKGHLRKIFGYLPPIVDVKSRGTESYESSKDFDGYEVFPGY